MFASVRHRLSAELPNESTTTFSNISKQFRCSSECQSVCQLACTSRPPSDKCVDSCIPQCDRACSSPQVPFQGISSCYTPV
ncbi:hypothetical protein ANCDUO_15366 [Ancylostoma duodenale]|uniref:Cysteine rich repeat-containing domain protein n=1 Tax=Ancylostoma duodenale TaxID=51022 RepID=A0A0C2CXA9_9BILA|nr:hypothetical protein ANCDUO_15366 [Ancylostoma duodenale]